MGLRAEVRGRHRADRQALSAAGRAAEPEKAAQILKKSPERGKIVEKMGKNTLQSGCRYGIIYRSESAQLLITGRCSLRRVSR